MIMRTADASTNRALRIFRTGNVTVSGRIIYGSKRSVEKAHSSASKRKAADLFERAPLPADRWSNDA
jgi:hypothetical protein